MVCRPMMRPSWFVRGLRGIGNLLGIGNLFDCPTAWPAGGSSPRTNARSVRFYQYDGDFQLRRRARRYSPVSDAA